MTAPGMEIIEPGPQTTVQDYPGRRGMQARGLFPSGPMDHLAFRQANVLVGNAPSAAGLEITLGPFEARIDHSGLIALCGAEGARPTLGGDPLPLWEAVPVTPGDVLACGVSRGPGFRLYLALSGGIEVPEVLGSRATHISGGVGGVAGRALIRGDALRLGHGGAGDPRPLRVPQALRPVYTGNWEVEVMRGPHADPDYLTAEDWRWVVSAAWRVDLNSDRTNVLLNSHRFTWSRSHGIAGGHPSNLLDGSFPLGGVTVNGDVPMIMGPDGTTSGGFTVVATVVHAGLWRVGQARPGRDTIRFREVELGEAIALAERLEYPLDPVHLERV